MATPRYPSPTNTFVPEATGQAIAYVRDPSRFKVNEYVQLVRAPKPVVLYAFLDPDEPVRVVTDAEYDWPDGQPRPRPAGNVGNFKWEEVRIFRRSYGYTVGEQLVETAEGWNPRAFFDAIILNKAMVNVTKRVMALLDNAANWGANTATATSLNGGAGNWANASNDPTSVNFLAIKKSLNAAVRRILLASNGLVTRKDLRLVIDPVVADAVGETSELHTYVEKSPVALAQIRGDAPNVNAPWSIPEQIYGLPVVVEDASYVNVRPEADGTAAVVETEKVFVADPTKARLVSRVGGVDGLYGAPSASTAQRYYYKYELAIEARHESWDKLHEASCVDQFKEVLAAPQTGFLITGVR